MLKGMLKDAEGVEQNRGVQEDWVAFDSSESIWSGILEWESKEEGKMAWNPREWWSQRRQGLETGGRGGCERCMQPGGGGGGGARFMIPSVKEVAEVTVDNLLHHERQHGSNQEEEERFARARACTDEGVRAGLKAGSIAGVAAGIPTLVAVRVFPWAKRNLNYTAQALIISAATIGAYFVTCEQTILACSRDASYARLAKEREAK